MNASTSPKSSSTGVKKSKKSSDEYRIPNENGENDYQDLNRYEKAEKRALMIMKVLIYSSLLSFFVYLVIYEKN